MSAMERLVQDGLVKHIGVSNFSVAQTEDARAALSRTELVSNQVEYSLTTRFVEEDILPYCAKEKVTLIAYSPLARGHISDSVPKPILRKYNTTAAQAMLNWVTRNPQVVAIPKAGSLPHLEENATSVRVRFEPSEYDLISAG
jgi:diketogulonate reductase-like aldo/keto reductase